MEQESKEILLLKPNIRPLNMSILCVTSLDSSSLLGVVIDLMHLMKPGGFDISLFFCDIVSTPEDESELGLQLEPCYKLEDLKKRVRAKEQRKRTMARLK